MIRKTLFAVLWLSTCTAVAAEPELRRWTDATARFCIDAELVRVEGDDCVLRKKTGECLTVPVSKLSQEDRKYIESLSEPADAVEGAGSEKRSVPDDVSLDSLTEIACACRTAEQVVSRFESILDDEQSSALVKSTIRQQLPLWRDRVERGFLQYDGKWLSAADVAEIKKQARELVAAAGKMLSVGNSVLAKENLLKASKIDPESTQADFTLGLLHALIGGNPPEARKHFSVCIRRIDALGEHATPLQRTNLAAALNNIAIAEVRLDRASSALRHWERAVELGIPVPEIPQNLGRLSDLAATGEFFAASNAFKKQAGRLYAMSAAIPSARPYERRTGWLYIPHIVEPIHDETDDEESDSDIAPASSRRTAAATSGTQGLRVFSSGSGFAISPTVIATNRHVVDDAIAFEIRANGELVQGVFGEVLGVSDEMDLALVQCKGLNAVPMRIEVAAQRLASEVRVLGYPETKLLGNSIKVTRGGIVAIPASAPRPGREIDQMLLLDAIANPGNSGGPVINRQGDVIGIVTLAIQTEQQYSAAVPAKWVTKLCDDAGIVLANLGQSPPAAEDDRWEDVVDAAAGSTYQLLALQKAAPSSWRSMPPDGRQDERPKPPPNWSGFEDRWCMHCDGIAHVSCPNRKCRNGVILGRSSEVFTPPGGRPVSRSFVTKDRCGTCGGNGRVSCPYCSSGFDPSL